MDLTSCGVHGHVAGSRARSEALSDLITLPQVRARLVNPGNVSESQCKDQAG